MDFRFFFASVLLGWMVTSCCSVASYKYGAAESKTGFSHNSNSEELLRGPFQETASLDFDGDGKQDNLILNWKIVRDYSVDREGIQSKEKKIWYQASIQIKSAGGKLIHDDILSMEEKDYNNFINLLADKHIPPDEYFQTFFTGKYNQFYKKMREIEQKDLNREDLQRMIESTNSKINVNDLEAELLQEKHLVLTYRGNWHEDLRIITYSKKIKKAVYLVNPY